MNKKAFTLIEVLVGITISMLLMVSVGILILGGIRNITSQEKTFQDSKGFLNFENKINDIFYRIDNSFSGNIISNGSEKGILLKIKNHFDEGSFVYIGTTNTPVDSENNGIYCLSGSENINTNHIFIKNFVPFEETSENLFNNFDDILDSNEITIGGKTYKSIAKKHQISVKNGDNWDMVIGRGIFGNHINEGSGGLETYLNNPTGLEKYGNYLLLSDTLNNRILYYDTINDSIHKLLDEDDGLLEPTGLYYDDSENSLYISNSGKGEVLKFYSKNITVPSLTIDGINGDNITNFKIDFFNHLGEQILSNKGTIEIEDHSLVSGDSYNNFGNSLNFTFSGGTSKSFNNEYIKINNLSGFSGTGNYYIKLDINNKFYPFFTQSDNNILTIDDNKLEIYSSGSIYETGFNGNQDSRNNFLDNNYDILSYDKKYDYIFENPVKDLSINYDNNSGILTYNLTHFRKYNCYNLEENIENTFLIKKNFK